MRSTSIAINGSHNSIELLIELHIIVILVNTKSQLEYLSQIAVICRLGSRVSSRNFATSALDFRMSSCLNRNWRLRFDSYIKSRSRMVSFLKPTRGRTFNSSQPIPPTPTMKMLDYWIVFIAPGLRVADRLLNIFKDSII